MEISAKRFLDSANSLARNDRCIIPRNPKGQPASAGATGAGLSQKDGKLKRSPDETE